MIDSVVYFLLPWAGLLAALSFALMALITAFGARQEEHTPYWAWSQFVLFSSAPLIFLSLFLAPPFLTAGAVIVVAAGLLLGSRKPEGKFRQNSAGFFAPVSKFSLLFALYLFCSLSVFTVAVIGFTWGESWTPHYEMRSRLLGLGFMSPPMVVALVFWRRAWSWGRRALVASSLTGVVSAVCLVAAWTGNERLRVDRFSIVPTNEGTLSYYVEMGLGLEPFDSYVVEAERSKSGVVLKKDGLQFDSSPSGKYRILYTPSSGAKLGQNKVRIVGSEGRVVAELGTLLTSVGLYQKPSGWSRLQDVYAHRNDDGELVVWDGKMNRNLGPSGRYFVWRPNGRVLVFSRSLKDGETEVVSYDLAASAETVLLKEKALVCDREGHQDCEISVLLPRHALSPDGRRLILKEEHLGPTVAEVSTEPPTSLLTEEEEDLAAEEESGELIPRPPERENYGSGGLILEIPTGHQKRIEGKSFPFWAPDSRLLCVHEGKAATWFDPESLQVEQAQLPIKADTFEWKEGRYLLFDERNCFYSTDLENWSDFPSQTRVVAFSPDGTKASSFDAEQGSRKKPRYIRIFDLKTKKQLSAYNFFEDLEPGFFESHPLKMKLFPPRAFTPDGPDVQVLFQVAEYS